MGTHEALRKDLDEKLARMEALKRQRPKRHCGHKEYSSSDDVAAAAEMEDLAEQIAKLRARIGRPSQA